MKKTASHRLFAGTALAVVLASAGAAAAAGLSDAQAYDIAPQPLDTALLQFSKQSGVQVISASTDLTGRRTDGVHGQITGRDALQALLKGSPLMFVASGDATVAISRAGGAAADGSFRTAASETPDAGNVVQELVVTAQKKSENIQVVPIAISAFTQQDLTTRQVAGGPDLMTQVPNMTFTKTNFSSYSIQIRGIGTQAISATTDPAVAVAFNNTPFVRNRFFEQEFYDLERVEVLRGPQGTLYGRNATAGVVNIISAKPNFDYEERLSADVGNYSSKRIEGMVNMPLVDDKVAVRLAGAWTKRDGYDINQITGNPIDGRDLWSTRLSLRFTPNDRIDANLIWEHFEEDDDRLRSGKQLCHKDIVTEVGGYPVTYEGSFPGSQATHYQSQLSQGCKPASLYAPESFETPNGYQFGFYQPISAIGLPIKPGAVDPYVSNVQSRDLRVIESTVDPSYKAKTDTVEFQIGFDLTDTLKLTSETAWATDFIFSTEDYNRFNTVPGAWQQVDPDTAAGPGRQGVLNNGVFCDPQIGCSDRLVSIDLSTAKSRHFSQEFRLSSSYDGKFNFSLGANFLRYDTEDKYYVFINALTLFAASHFASGISTPYVPNVSDNHECLPKGLEIIDLNNFGGVGTAGSCTYIEPNPIGSLDDLGHNYFLSRNPYKLISYAAFGEAYYQITDNLKLTGGLRWTVDKKEAPRIPSWILAQGVGYPVLEVVKQEWREPTGRLTLDWKPDLGFTDQTLVYLSLARGYKAGGANPPPAGVALNVNTGAGVPTPSDTHPLTFDPEFVNAIEIGSKNTFLDGRLTANLAAFYYDYKGYQISQIVDRSAINKNFDAKVWGLEIETDWRPLKNLRLGFKGGYESTRVADGMKAVDVMDRTAGHTDWIVVKPFPIFPSNCIVPVYLSAYNGYVHQMGNVAGSGNSSPCETAYFQGLDPITMAPYIPNPPNENGGWFFSNAGFGTIYPNYPGFNPASAPNNGEGFDKDLSGNELPNAPHFTATITADFTVPLPRDWLVTLHADLYGQSEAWARIFNTPGYDRIKAYTNVNLAAIFSNDAAGLKAMFYVKNIFDHDSITGAFLNSDDTGLTTNVFLNEPRLFGVRVTKEWNGVPVWGTLRGDGGKPHTPGEPYPLSVELGGQVQRQDAPSEALASSFIDHFSPALQQRDMFNRDLDWGDGREVKLTYRPAGSAWAVSAGVRYGKTNQAARGHTEEAGGKGCAFPDSSPAAIYCGPQYYGIPYFYGLVKDSTNWTDATASEREDHTIINFRVGRDAGLGGLSRSALGVELRYGQFNSKTTASLNGIPNWDIADGWLYDGYPATANSFESTLDARRRFRGLGPILSWEASRRLLGNEEIGHLDVDWSIAGGALFGKQKTSITGQEQSGDISVGKYNSESATTRVLTNVVVTPVNIQRSKSATVPVIDLSLGLSYEIQRVKVSTGYRWERYFNVIDGGYRTPQSFDRTFDGPYFKVSLGFGG